MKILHLTDDLMTRVRLESRWKQAGAEVTRQEGDEPPGLVVLDLRRGSAEAEIQRLHGAYPEVGIVAYGPHVDADTLRAARAAGADEVVAQGKAAERVLARLQRGDDA